MSTLILLNQDRNLLLKEYERLEMDFHSLKTEIDGFTNMIPINQRQKVSLSLRQLIFGYCDSISEFGAFLTGLRQQGIQPIWESEQWTKTTYPTLIKDFNSLTELLKTLRKDAPKNLQSCFPDDRSIKTFAELVPDKGGSQS
jgi:hypothetical protein